MGIIEELKKERVKEDTTIHKLVLKIYDELLKMIRFKNKNGVVCMVYEIPVIFPGFPLYDRAEVGYKLNKLLKKKGFKTTMDNTKIYINW